MRHLRRSASGFAVPFSAVFYTTTTPLLFFSWLKGSRQNGSDGYQRRTPSVAASTRADLFMKDGAEGLGGADVGQPFTAGEAANGTAASDALVQQLRGKNGAFHVGGGVAPGSTVPKENVDSIFMERADHLMGPKRQPVTYDVDQQRQKTRMKTAEAAALATDFNGDKNRNSMQFDELNMPRDGNHTRADWEYIPTPEHRSLVLLLYRNVLKGLLNYKSVRRRSMIAYTRMAFRRRAMATEKLLIDECIEECRRAIYVLQKHHTFSTTRVYEFDSMNIPKDTGQDVKTYMEEVYDPEMSRMQFQNFTDVQPGKEHLHRQGLGPTSGAHHWKEQRSSAAFKVEIREDDKALRPPPPPEMTS